MGLSDQLRGIGREVLGEDQCLLVRASAACAGPMTGRMLTVSEGGMVGCGQMRCLAGLSWWLLILCLTALGVNGQDPLPTLGQLGEQLLDRTAVAAAIWSGERPGGQSPGGG